eukprot:gene15819-biopygen7121
MATSSTGFLPGLPDFTRFAEEDPKGSGRDLEGNLEGILKGSRENWRAGPLGSRSLQLPPFPWAFPGLPSVCRRSVAVLARRAAEDQLPCGHPHRAHAAAPLAAGRDSARLHRVQPGQQWDANLKI